MQKFGLYGYQVDRELKMTGDNNKNVIRALLLSLLAPSAEWRQLSARGNAKRNSQPLLPWLPTKRPAVIFLWFVTSTRIFLAKAVYMVLGSSYLSDKILALV